MVRSEGGAAPVLPVVSSRRRLRRGRFRIAAAALVVIIGAVFGQTARHQFLNYDDNTYVVNNAMVNGGFSGEGFRQAWRPHAANWHPLTWISHMLDVQLFGLRPGPHHLVNVALHAAAAVLLLSVLQALTGAFWRSVLVAALFAVHPLHVESVAWVAERKDVLAGVFWFLTMAAYVGYLRRPGRRHYAVLVAAFGLGLAAKPMLVTLPVVLLLLDYWPLGRLGPGATTEGGGAPPTRTIARLVREKAPLFALAAADGLATLFAQSSGLRRLIDPALPLCLANATVSYAAYLLKMLWPAGLAPFYPFPLGGIPGSRVLAAGIVLLILTAWSLRSLRSRPSRFVGWFWYGITLLPVIGIYQVGSQARADRYTYLPLVGVFVAVAWEGAAWTARTARARAPAAVCAAVVVALLSSTAWVQVGHWKDSVTLMTHAARATENNYVALNNIGTTILDERKRPAAAIPYFQEALKIKPDHLPALFNIGLAAYRAGRYQEAYAAYAKVLDYVPGDLDARYTIGLVLLRLRRPAEAARHFAYILEEDPGYRDTRTELEVARLQMAKAAGSGGR